MSIDKCVDLCDHYHNKDIEYFYPPHPQKVPLCTFEDTSPSPMPRYPDIFSVTIDLFLLVPEFHTNRITWYVAFCIWLLSLGMFFKFFHIMYKSL